MKNIFKSLMVCSVLCGGAMSAFGVRSGIVDDVTETGAEVDWMADSRFEKGIEGALSDKMAELIEKEYWNLIVKGGNVEKSVKGMDKEIWKYIWKAINSESEKFGDVKIDGAVLFENMIDKEKLGDAIEEGIENFVASESEIQTFLRDRMKVEENKVNDNEDMLLNCSEMEFDFERGFATDNKILKGKYEKIKEAYKKTALSNMD